MKISMRISLLGNVLLASVCLVFLCQRSAEPVRAFDEQFSALPFAQLGASTNPNIGADSIVPGGDDPIEGFAVRAPFVTQRVECAYPAPPPPEVVALLEAKKAEGVDDHFGALLEYGLRVHLGYLEHTKLSRELPLDSNLMLAELVRLAEIPEYTGAHEAGWLNSQFLGEFSRTGHSSYQIYLWAKEHRADILSDDERFPNRERIGEILNLVDSSSLNGVGGGEVCHYHCV